ncbi:glycosyltransferase family 4 protein [Hyphomonas sp. CACIAM 19H1]|uniref:glycosyltransferase family 4 protein n=1 Tax=Hyphomonas sp. CACIAM 19H1 TaxID=1873716 RepID=UPI001F1F7C4E|nr:glycosyltransferase family 4 protein [Hyphomonas sp. CACIAM 19H1]
MILQVAPELSAGGVERTVLEVTEAIVEAGGRALLASRGGRLEAEFERLGGELFRMDAKSRNPLTIRINEGKLRQIIREEKVDLVHARSRAPAWSAYAAAKAESVPFVTTYHGAYSGTSGLKRAYNSVMAKGDIVIANSNWIADHICQVHQTPADRIVTIPRGVDLAEFDPKAVAPARVDAIRQSWGLLGDKRLTLFLPGRLTEWKGQGLAIDAFAALAPDERAGMVLVLAGDPQGRDHYVDALQNKIAGLDLERSVIIVPHIGDMAAAYLASDIVLAPSTRPEAFGRVAAEAAAMERPVIVSDHGGGRETVIEYETGARVQPGDARALSGALRAMIGLGPTVRASMGAAGRAHVLRHFSKRGLQTATLNVYKRLLEKGN